MRPVVVLAALVASATAFPFRLLSFTAASTKTSAKDKTAVVYNFEQNKQYHNHHVHSEEKENTHQTHPTAKLTHHRLPLHGNDYSYSYRFQRSNTNPGKAVVYAPDRTHSQKKDDKKKASHATPVDKLTYKHHSRGLDNIDAAALTAPPPCQPMSPPPDEAATKARFDQFAHAFLVTKNITEAFTYISEGYINHNPAAKNGAASAWGILSPIWASQSITVLRTTFKGNFGWLNYRAGGLGEVVDRYRWDAGCIVEHWDQGEKYPSS
ncbi:hypothetical protein Sste5346_002916 [Sporothrix stenoceras]|uniref:Uncharacterized protein n=1 Tax=Sporothrix stenoceras TaxID=5173 RepID=A0ABR3ZH33_9PEZI